jgi:hypothetical protein
MQRMRTRARGRDRALLSFMVAMTAAHSGCASRAAPPGTETISPAPSFLEPTPAALHAADTIRSGREMGGMWTFDRPPLARWQREYAFTPTEAWLERVRLSTVRYGDYCSGALISANGLFITTHHCVRECLSSYGGNNDLLTPGFYAPTYTQERVCPNLFVDQLLRTEDVTARVRTPEDRARSGASGDSARAARVAAIEKECSLRTGNVCQIVAFYNGARHYLHEYHRWTTVKLVFAPELQAGYFGGAFDDFTFPRYGLDIAFLRVYGSNGAPEKTPYHLSWRPEGASPGELVFVSGFPRVTFRLFSVAQFLYEKNYRHQMVIDLMEGQRQVLKPVVDADPEGAAGLRNELFSIESSLKAYRGQLDGLEDPALEAFKIRFERELRASVERSAALRLAYGDVFDRLAELQTRKHSLSPRLNASNLQMVGAPHFVFAAQLLTYLREMSKPESERLPAYRGASLARTTEILTSESGREERVAVPLLRLHVDLMRVRLPPSDPLRVALFQRDTTTEAVVERLRTRSRILDPAYRQQIMRAGSSALTVTDDAVLRFAVTADSAYRSLARQWDAVVADERRQRERYGQVILAVHGDTVPPDATWTPRISDGVVKGYPYNGTIAPPFSTYFGMYGRASEFDNKLPWALSPEFARKQDSVNMAVPLNMVSTNDLAGGSSGSPLIDREGRFVGLVFDSNMEHLASRFVFRSTVGRTISVHAAGILEALRTVYEARALVDEISGTESER